jgi:hypothetical protein
MKPIAGFAFFTLASFLSSVSACGTNAETDARETVLINNAKAFADAFQKGDAKAVSAFWAEDGDYVDDSAHRFEGRVASYEHLRGLEWAVGDWADEEDGPEVSLVTFEWSSERNFLISTQSVTVGDTLVSGVTEWIGWDPATSQLRSCSFEANGGTGQGVWSNEGNEWIIQTNLILPGGKKLSATNVVTRNGPDVITWQSKDRTLDGETLPDAKQITMKRVPLTTLH